MKIDLETLLSACADDSFEDGIRIDTALEPLAGPGAPVKPAVYEGGKYQMDARWASPDDEKPTEVVVIDNVPSQANRLEAALLRHRDTVGIPELVLDLSDCEMPAHLPKRLSSLQFPHRNADAYLRDARLDGKDFAKTKEGEAIMQATPWQAGALMSWFPQALLYGFWQSHWGKKGTQTKHARAWVSELIGWNPAKTTTRTMGLKGDPLNLNIDDKVAFDPNRQDSWRIHKGAKVKGEKNDKLSEIGHGQVPFMSESDASPAAISFASITQQATVSFAQLRRVSLGPGEAEADSAARALLVALGLHAHALAFGGGFALRSRAELRPTKMQTTWLGSGGDSDCSIGGPAATGELLEAALNQARSVDVPLDGWGEPPLQLKPRQNLVDAISKTWPSKSE